MLLTNIVRVCCVLIDAALLTAATVGTTRAVLRWHRRGLARVRAAGRPVAEPRSNVVPLLRGRA